MLNDTISDEDLEFVSGGAQLDPNVPLKSRDRLVQQCGPQIDAYTAARTAAGGAPGDTRKEIDAAAAGRSLAVCSENAGFDPLPGWRYAPNGKQ